MIKNETVHLLLDELEKAVNKHPEFAKSAEKGLSLITEECGELAASINDGESKFRQIEEASHVAVTAIRFIEGKLRNDF